MKSIFKYLLVVSVYFTVCSSAFFVPVVSASGLGTASGGVALIAEERPFLLESLIFIRNKIINLKPSIVRSTGDFMAAASTNFPSIVFFGMNPDDLGTCGAAFLYDAATRAAGPIPELAELVGADGVFTIEVLERAKDQAAVIGCDSLCSTNTFLGMGNGSVMALAQRGVDVMGSDPVPVNFAYYFKHNLQKIPVINRTAYAQTSYSGFGLELTLGLWETSRNIAYAMMAIIMLVIGIMIISRKKLNPQTSVSVQTALPRVVISLILITFSYPIGAIMASMITYFVAITLKLFFGSIINAVATGPLVMTPESMFDICKLLIYVPLLMTAMKTLGLLTAIVVIVMLGITFIVLLVVLIKMMLVYMKIMLEIIIAPLQFAFAAIPGQEEIITNWFKRMIAYVLAIPAMWFFIFLAWYILMKPMFSPEIFFSMVSKSSVISPLSLMRSASSAALTIAMLPALSVMVMFLAIGADNRIKEFILGESKPKKRK